MEKALIQISVTKEEKKFFMSFAKAKGMTLSALAKNLLINDVATTPQEVLNVCRNLAK